MTKKLFHIGFFITGIIVFFGGYMMGEYQAYERWAPPKIRASDTCDCKIPDTSTVSHLFDTSKPKYVYYVWMFVQGESSGWGENGVMFQHTPSKNEVWRYVYNWLGKEEKYRCHITIEDIELYDNEQQYFQRHDNSIQKEMPYRVMDAQREETLKQ